MKSVTQDGRAGPFGKPQRKIDKRLTVNLQKGQSRASLRFVPGGIGCLEPGQILCGLLHQPTEGSREGKGNKNQKTGEAGSEDVWFISFS